MHVECIPHPSTFPLVTSKCSGLKDVRIGMAPGPALSKFICTLHHLETLVVTNLNMAALSHIARLPGLRYLWLMSFPIPSFQLPAGSIPFPALQKLEYESIEHAPRLLALLIKCALVELTIIARGSYTMPPPNTIAQQFYAALADHCSHSSLQKLDVQKGYWTLRADQRGICLVGEEIIRPLFSFSSLVEVSLSHPFGVDLDDAVVRKMARAWPLIESLLLPPGLDENIAPRVTLEGIYAFAEHCPRLRRLHLAFDATVIPKIKTKGKKNACQCSLDYLDVSDSPISKARPVAKFLSAIFPHLGMINTLYEDLDGTDTETVLTSHRRWKKVEEALW
ncbi:hypothetical protein DFH08DRAFT_988119 [Mycena albidolilacea]|uniref:F-box protein n=1 Tax=Mycena albidolilacea TaxID=1033008 RepID=A0AAD7AAR1_9AGAR|nr:hypothetical protein DFH08DRAFT_988119 [Mycena albidolilacea]